RDPGGRVVSASARKRAAAATDASDESTELEEAPLIKEADPEFERLLAEEEEIERSTQEHSETPHFRAGDGD
ncbi:MAG: hypothetical protein JST73_04615, partial [Actinobacteria bacterium]|nr:hypothetical protein [Actinomycetota bacterium]